MMCTFYCLIVSALTFAQPFEIFRFVGSRCPKHQSYRPLFQPMELIQVVR